MSGASQLPVPGCRAVWMPSGPWVSGDDLRAEDTASSWQVGSGTSGPHLLGMGVRLKASLLPEENPLEWEKGRNPSARRRGPWCPPRLPSQNPAGTSAGFQSPVL